jgi:DNA modification methylase
MALMQRVIADYTLPGDMILEPFAGSGTTGRAAKDIGRRAILIEQDRDTCELAAKVLRPRALGNRSSV